MAEDKGVVKEVDIIEWDSNKTIEFLEKNKDIVVLIDEESCYYIIPQVDLVIEDWSSRHTRGTMKYSIKRFIEILKE